MVGRYGLKTTRTRKGPPSRFACLYDNGHHWIRLPIHLSKLDKEVFCIVSLFNPSFPVLFVLSFYCRPCYLMSDFLIAFILSLPLLFSGSWYSLIAPALAFLKIC